MGESNREQESVDRSDIKLDIVDGNEKYNTNHENSFLESEVATERSADGRIVTIK